MANISNNQLHETLDEATMASILQKIEEIFNLLPQRTLTAEERKQYQSLDMRNLAFVEDVVRLKNGIGASILPAVLLNDAVDTDLKLFKQINTLRGRVQGLDYLLKDVERIVAHEGYSVGLTHYAVYKIAARVGIPHGKSALEELKWRFNEQGPNKGMKPGPFH